MARAKRTERAAARRRYRHVTTAMATSDESGPEATALPAAAVAERPRAAAANPSETSPTPAARPSITAAFRSAIKPADVRGDIRALPHIVFRTRAVVIPVVLIGVTGVTALVGGAQSNFIVVLAFQAFLIPPPLAASFLGGILAPRAAWLVGGLIGVFSAIVFSAVIVIASDDTLRGLFRASAIVPEGFRQAYVVQAFVTAPLLGVAVGAFAGFYRRFLRSSNPNANRAGGSRRAPARR